MEINNTLSKQQLAILQANSQAQKGPGSSSDADTTNNANQKPGVADDSVKLSANSQQLAQVSIQPGTANPQPITDNKQAQNIVAKVVSDIRNNPDAAINAYSNLATLNFKTLLG